METYVIGQDGFQTTTRKDSIRDVSIMAEDGLRQTENFVITDVAAVVQADGLNEDTLEKENENVREGVTRGRVEAFFLIFIKGNLKGSATVRHGHENLPP